MFEKTLRNGSKYIIIYCFNWSS